MVLHLSIKIFQNVEVTIFTWVNNAGSVIYTDLLFIASVVSLNIKRPRVAYCCVLMIKINFLLWLFTEKKNHLIFEKIYYVFSQS